MKTLILIGFVCLSVLGTSQITSEDLSGSGESPVVADADGKLKRAGFRYIRIPSSAFQLEFVDNTITYNANAVSANVMTSVTNNSIMAPVLLPNNCTITQITIQYIDDDMFNNVDFSLFSYDGTTFNDIDLGDSSGSSSDVTSFAYTSPITINNQTTGYTIAMKPKIGDQLTSNLKMISVTIQYVE